MKGTKKYYFRKSARSKYAKYTKKGTVQNYTFVHGDNHGSGYVDGRIRECDGRKRSMKVVKVAKSDLISPKAYTWYESSCGQGTCPYEKSTSSPVKKKTATKKTSTKKTTKKSTIKVKTKRK